MKKINFDLEFIVDTRESNTRLDIYVTRQIKDLSRTQLSNLIKKKLVFVNDKFFKSSYRVQTGDHVKIKFLEPCEVSLEPQEIALDIIYEDRDLLVINKSQGIVVHPAIGNHSGTLVNALLFYFKNNLESLSNLNGVSRPGIVHRLDKNTSGLLVVAKNNFAHRVLADQFAAHNITREYIAIVEGVLHSSGEINQPIARDKYDRKKFCVNQFGRLAITKYHLLENFRNHALVKLTLETGRTHQIRVHMASINHAILGDDIYGHRDKNLLGQTLHARVLGFKHPRTQNYIEFQKEPPDYFLKLINKFRA